MINLFDDEKLSDKDRTCILTGKPAGNQKEAGRTVCSCFNVGINTIVEAIPENKLTIPEQIEEVLKAGSNCGSCVPELREIIDNK